MARIPAGKIAVPELPSWFVPRPETLRRLDHACGAQLVAVIAPAGSGKTTIMAEWARRDLDTPTAWVSVDADDADPRRLRTAVLAAVVASGAAPAGSAAVRLLSGPEGGRLGDGEDPTDELLDALEVLRPSVRLVLDDVHALAGSRAATDVIARLLRRNPAGVHLVIAARADPPLALPRLRVDGLLAELRADQLQFAPEEAAALLEASGVELDADEVALLHRRTEGWAAGLRLAAIALRRSSVPRAVLAGFTGDDHSVADYLAGEVLSGLPSARRSLLQDLSVCRHIPIELAVALTGRPDAAHDLDELVRQSVMVERVAPSEYRLHGLLRAHLVADLARHRPARHRQLHAEAARWWTDAHERAHALRHAEQAQAPGLVAELVRREGLALLLSGHLAPLKRALAVLGPQGLQNDARLALTAALTHLEDREPDAASADLALARNARPAEDDPFLKTLTIATELLATGMGATADGAGGAASPVVEPPEPELAALVHLGRAAAVLVPASRASAAAVHGDLRRAATLARTHGFTSLEVNALTLLAAAACADGDVRAVAAAAEDALAVAARLGHRPSTRTALATALAAYAELMSGEPARARARCAEALDRGEALLPDATYALQVVHAVALGDEGFPGEQQSGMTEARAAREALGPVVLPAPMLGALTMLEVRAAILLGHHRAGVEVIDWVSQRTGETAEVVLMRAWTHAASGRAGEARALVTTLPDDEAARGQMLVEVHLLVAEAALQEGDDVAARAALKTAVRRGRTLDLVRPFVEAGVCSRALLLGSGGQSDPFGARIAAACAATPLVPSEPLSERELVVLALLPTMLNAPAMAEELVVSVNTVKTQIRSIYAKLGVSTRRDAVSRAHERELLA